MKKNILLYMLATLGVVACHKDETFIIIGDEDPIKVTVDGEDVTPQQPSDDTVTFNFAQNEFVIGQNSSSKGASSSKVGDASLPHFWPDEDITITFTSSTASEVTAVFNPSNTASFTVELPAARWTYSGQSSNYDATFSNTVGFIVAGEVVAYGQPFTTDMAGSTNHGFVSIEDAELGSVTVTDGTETHTAANVDAVVVDETHLNDPRDIAYFYVATGTDYEVEMTFASDKSDPTNFDSTGVATGLNWDRHTHYHYGVTINRENAISPGTYNIQIETFAFQRGQFTLGTGTIDLNAVFNATGCDTVWQIRSTVDPPYNQFWVHDNHPGWTITASGDTPLTGIQVANSDDSSLDTSFTVTDNTQAEADRIVQEALEYICNDGVVGVDVTPATGGGSNTQLRHTNSRTQYNIGQVMIPRNGQNGFSVWALGDNPALAVGDFVVVDTAGTNFAANTVVFRVVESTGNKALELFAAEGDTATFEASENFGIVEINDPR